MWMLVLLARLWMRLLRRRYRRVARPPVEVAPALAGFFSPELLAGARVAVVDRLPRPPLLGLLKGGRVRKLLEEAMEMGGGLTVGDLYFVVPRTRDDPAVHAHELVHVVQYGLIGHGELLRVWLSEALGGRYLRNPIEEIAYQVQREFQAARQPFDIERRVRELMSAKGMPGK